MAYVLKIFSSEETSQWQREQAASRFRSALEDGLGDAALVAPVYRAYQRLVMAYGDSPRPWPLSADEQVLAEQWESAELAAVTAAFGSDRYMGDADYSIEVGTDTPADAGSFFD